MSSIRPGGGLRAKAGSVSTLVCAELPAQEKEAGQSASHTLWSPGLRLVTAHRLGTRPLQSRTRTV